MPILIAGLDRHSLLMEAPVLQREGDGLLEVGSARELLELLARDGGRLIVLGSRLADLEVPEAIRRIRRLPSTRGASVLVLLGSEDRGLLETAALRAGANAILRRPLDRGRLESWVAKLLQVPRRVEARIPVQGQVVGSPRAETGGHFCGLSRNLSVHGMLLASPVRLPEVPDLDLEIQLPDGGSRVRALGRVVREAVEVGWPYLGYGVEFLFVPEESREEIGRLVGRRGSPRRGALAEAEASVLSTIRRGLWVYEIVRPVAWEGGFLAEIRRGSRDGWRPGLSGPYYVVEAASAEAALREARAFVNRQE